MEKSKAVFASTKVRNEALGGGVRAARGAGLTGGSLLPQLH